MLKNVPPCEQTTHYPSSLFPSPRNVFRYLPFTDTLYLTAFGFMVAIYSGTAHISIEVYTDRQHFLLARHGVFIRWIAVSIVDASRLLWNGTPFRRSVHEPSTVSACLGGRVYPQMCSPSFTMSIVDACRLLGNGNGIHFRPRVYAPSQFPLAREGVCIRRPENT